MGANLPGQSLTVVRPAEPGRLVRLPLGRHAVAAAAAGDRRRVARLNRGTAAAMPPYASMRRSRRNGQLRRTSSMRREVASRPTRISSSSVDASAITTPNGSATNDVPQNSSPAALGGLSWPTRFTAATNTPLAIACERWIVCQASRCAAPYSRLLVRVPADRGRVEEHRGARAAPSGARPPGTTGPSRSSVPMRPACVSNAWKPRSPGVK